MVEIVDPKGPNEDLTGEAAGQWEQIFPIVKSRTIAAQILYNFCQTFWPLCFKIKLLLAVQCTYTRPYIHNVKVSYCLPPNCSYSMATA